MLRFTRFTKNFSRPFAGLFAVLFVCFALIFADESASAQNSRNKSKAAPTPKKNTKATPTPKKRAQAKATPTPKKTTREKANASAGKKTTDRNKPSSTKPNQKTSAKTSKDTKKSGAAKTAAKNSRSDDRSSSRRNSSRGDSPKNASSRNKSNPARETRTTGAASKKTTTTRTAARETSAKTRPETPTNSEQLQIIVTDVSARLRNQARAGAAEVSRVKLGTVLRVTEKNPAWYRVQYSAGGKTSSGWISANAVNDLNAGARDELYRQIVERNYKTEMDLAAASELLDFMSRAGSEMEKSDASAEMELKRLLLLRDALRKIPAGQSEQAPYREFLKAHEKSVVYSEPAGEWMVVSNQFWELHKKYQPAPIADRIAWEAAQNPMPGECEGYVNCHLFYLRMTNGEYLRLHPQGARATDALKDLTAFLEPIVADAAQKQVYQGPTDVTDRAEFNNLIAELRTIVSRLTITEKDKPLQQLRQLAEAFR